MKKLFLAMIVLVGQLTFAGGDNVGNGGDLCELRFQNVRNDIASWIINGGSSGLNLSKEISLNKYNNKMLSSISQARVSCVEEKLFVGSAEKTCKNQVNQQGTPIITCNIERFMNSNESDQYVLVHHEYAGLSGFEINEDEGSNYFISDQITGYLETQEVKKLAVKPLSSSTCPKLDGEYLCQGSTDSMIIKSVIKDGITIYKIRDVVFRADDIPQKKSFTSSNGKPAIETTVTRCENNSLVKVLTRKDVGSSLPYFIANYRYDFDDFGDLNEDIHLISGDFGNIDLSSSCQKIK
jgi:hypothetical protein